jgi:hypothetical protein
MFTINLKDVQLDEKLEDKHFEHSDRYQLIEEVASFIKENHPGSFPNPVTLNRKIDEVIKDEVGLTQNEANLKRDEEIMFEITNNAELLKTKTAPIREKYEQMIKESAEKFSSERSALLEEHTAERDDEARETIQVRIENNTYEAQQDFERLLKEQQEAINAVESEN